MEQWHSLDTCPPIWSDDHPEDLVEIIDSNADIFLAFPMFNRKGTKVLAWMISTDKDTGQLIAWRMPKYHQLYNELIDLIF